MSATRQRKQLVGTVVSNKMDRTIVVLVERQIMHARCHKYIRRHKKYMAHDGENACDVGDVVMIEECRPLSRRKRWRLRRTVRKVVQV